MKAWASELSLKLSQTKPRWQVLTKALVATLLTSIRRLA